MRGICGNCGHVRADHPTPDICTGEDGLGCTCGEYWEKYRYDEDLEFDVKRETPQDE
jgi:hypothetical protein